MAEFGNLPTIEPVVEKLDGKTVVTLGTVHFTEGNAAVRAALEDADVVELRETFAQRYLGCGMPVGKRLEIHGVPGNDMACYMDGGEIEVFGNAQDQVANTMNDGDIVIHGRVGIHMKQYGDKAPAIVIGGDAGSFLGEYMAGGVIVLMGTAGPYLATGMHGGVIYLKHVLDERDIPAGLVQEPVDERDCRVLARLLGEYNEKFAEEIGGPVDATGEGFFRLRPANSRPYASMYAN